MALLPGRDKKQKKTSAKKSADKNAPKGKDARAKHGLESVPAVILRPRLMFIVAVVLLCAIGLVMIYSSSSITAYSDYEDAAFFFKRQVIFLAAGVVACVILAKVPHRFYAHPYVAWGFWALTIVLLLGIAIIGNTKLGATRSLSIAGFDIQPTEFAKISLIILMAHLMERMRNGELSAAQGVLMIGVSVVVTVALIFIQPDLGSAMILLVGVLVVGLMAGLPWRYVAILAGMMALYFVFVAVFQPYHLVRLKTMLDPFADASDTGYQSVQGLLALGSGGIFGTGLGLSRQKYLYLPYAYNDFIYAVIGEELGLVGAATVLLLFALFIYAGFLIARNAPDIFGCMMTSGLVAIVGFQACLNMAMIVGIAPVTGKALPFISYGGSSLLSSMVMVGLVLSVSIHSSIDARYERRRDNLMVYDGGKGKAPQAKGRVVGRIVPGRQTAQGSRSAQAKGQARRGSARATQAATQQRRAASSLTRSPRLGNSAHGSQRQQGRSASRVAQGRGTGAQRPARTNAGRQQTNRTTAQRQSRPQGGTAGSKGRLSYSGSAQRRSSSKPSNGSGRNR